MEGLERLNQNLQRSNSFWQTFLRGIVSGLGFAIGSIIIFGIVLYFLGRTPLIGKYIAGIIKEVQNNR